MFIAAHEENHTSAVNKLRYLINVCYLFILHKNSMKFGIKEDQLMLILENKFILLPIQND